MEKETLQQTAAPAEKTQLEGGEVEKDMVQDSAILGEKAHVNHGELAALRAFSEEELVLEKKLVRKIDSLILPQVVLIYLMNYIDRNNYPAARLQGLQEDLGLTDSQYQLGLSILFVGYILAQVPSNMLLNYIGRPSYYLGFFTVAWGLVSALTSQVKGYGSIVACRFFLGFVEAPFFPGVLFYLSKWYSKKELAFRMSIFYCGSLISGAFGNLIAAGILSGLAGARGMSAWQWLYIIEGSITVVIGLFVSYFLPDFPHTWKRLSPELRHIAERRLAMEAADADLDDEGAASQLRGAKLAFSDPKTYILAVAYMSIVGAGGFQNYFPTLTATLGYSRIISLVLVAPPYLLVVFYSVTHCFYSDRFQNRFWFYMYPAPIAIVGFAVFMATDTFGPRYLSCFLFLVQASTIATTLSWASSSIPRPPAKRAVALAFINSIGNSASVWTPFTYRKQDTPHYLPAMVINIILECLAMAAGVTLLWYLKKQNKELERLENEDVPLSDKDMKRLRRTAQQEGLDLASARRLQKGFRYML